MSLVARQWFDESSDMMCCWCPSCGELVYIDDDDEYAVLDDGNKEYFLYCPECGQGFYASKSYD